MGKYCKIESITKKQGDSIDSTHCGVITFCIRLLSWVRVVGSHGKKKLLVEPLSMKRTVAWLTDLLIVSLHFFATRFSGQ